MTTLGGWRMSVAMTNCGAGWVIYVDVRLIIHHWWVTKRLVKGLFANPEGWPADSPIWASTMNSYKVLWRCDHRLTLRYQQLMAQAALKRTHHLRSPREIRTFLDAVRQDRKNPNE
jgi:hypothetical protein